MVDRLLAFTIGRTKGPKVPEYCRLNGAAQRGLRRSLPQVAEHNITGSTGEALAGSYLEEHGMQVLERNWRQGRHELDIIARHGRELVIVEVKTRSSEQYGQPLEAVKKGKRGKLIKAANAYVQATGCELALRFDIVSIILHSTGKHYIHHIPDAFYPTVHDKP